ncbi:MAG: hypothetical protein ACLTG0_10565 [Oscillibacter sp.]|mgnify:FL=1
MSINTYDEQKFWEEMDILFPDIVKAITSLAKKVLHIHNQSAERRDMVVREDDGIFWYAGELYHPRTRKIKKIDSSG